MCLQYSCDLLNFHLFAFLFNIFHLGLYLPLLVSLLYISFHIVIAPIAVVISGENAISPLLSLVHFFSACRTACLLILSNFSYIFW